MAAKRESTRLWPAGVVPYEINQDLANIVGIETAMRRYEALTNIRFVGRLFQKDFIRFSPQTAGEANAREGRKGGEQFVNASLDDVGTLLHELGHTVGLMHEHQRDDRDDFIIFHPERLNPGQDPGQFEKKATEQRTGSYDFRGIMHYNAGSADNPIFESKTGIPLPSGIGGQSDLTPSDRDLLAVLYPAAPVIRRSSGHGGAGAALQTSALATPSVNGTAILATAVQDGGGKYHLVRWRVRRNGNITRIDDLPDSVGGKATNVHMIAVQRLFVAAMKDDSGRLTLISHGDGFQRLRDARAGTVRALHAVSLAGPRLVVACISAAGRLKLIVWLTRPDGSIVRLFDSGDNGPGALAVAAAALPAVGASQRVAVLIRTTDGRLQLSLWQVDSDSVERVADSGQQIGSADFGQVIVTSSARLVVVCRDASRRLTLIPFEIAADGTALRRITGADVRAGTVREIATVRRPYGLLTSVINSGGNILLIKWNVDPTGRITRRGDSGDQAGEGSQLSVASLPFADKTTVCTVVRSGSGMLVPISWDDADGPGELHID